MKLRATFNLIEGGAYFPRVRLFITSLEPQPEPQPEPQNAKLTAPKPASYTPRALQQLMGEKP